MLLTASVAGYLTSSFLSGPLISRLGVCKVLAISCCMTGVALISYTFVPVCWMWCCWESWLVWGQARLMPA